MSKISKDFKYYSNYILILIGLGIVSWIIWSRFIRSRVPKDIPFELTEKWFFIILYICIIYFYVVYKLIRPGKSNEALNIFVDLVYSPLKAFDEYIKNNSYIKPKYLKVVDKVVVWLSYTDLLKQMMFIKRIYISCYIIPRIILVSILFIDTFYFNKVELIYKIILLGVLPLIHRYFKYCFKYIKEFYLKELTNKYKYVYLVDKNYDQLDWEHDPTITPYHNKSITTQEYIPIALQMSSINDDNIGYMETPISYDFIMRQYLKDKYNSDDPKYLKNEDYIYFEQEFKKWMPIILNLSVFLQNYSEVDDFYFITDHMHITIKHIKIMIFGLYGICWSYIIYRSYHMIPYPFIDTLCMLMTTLPGLEEPFSGDLLIYWEIIE